MSIADIYPSTHRLSSQISCFKLASISKESPIPILRTIMQYSHHLIFILSIVIDLNC